MVTNKVHIFKIIFIPLHQGSISPIFFAAFMRGDPKNAKNSHQFFFFTFGILSVKAARKMLVKLTLECDEI